MYITLMNCLKDIFKVMKVMLLISSLFWLNSFALASENISGKEKAFTCLGCHGQAGLRNAYPNYHVPRLAGQTKEYIEAALKAYKNGERDHPTMQGNASTLSEEDISEVATYFSSL